MAGWCLYKEKTNIIYFILPPCGGLTILYFIKLYLEPFIYIIDCAHARLDPYESLESLIGPPAADKKVSCTFLFCVNPVISES